MTDAFIRVFNLSISAGWLVLAVIAFRLIFKRAPKRITPILWGIVAIRLIFPFSVESGISLVPSSEVITSETIMSENPEINSGFQAVDNIINPMLSDSLSPNPGDSANPMQIIMPLLSYIWLAGMGLMLVYALISWLRLKRKVDTAVRLRDNIYQSENIPSPFVLGVVKPKIYIPFGIAENYLPYIIAHEEAHIRRKDHLWKPLGFILLSVYWFNPLMWLAYILLCRDIETACDEKVIASLEPQMRADYSQALLACSKPHRMVSVCPLAFGEVGVKERVKNILSYKKPAFWIIAAAIVVSAVIAICFLTSPQQGIIRINGHLYAEEGPADMPEGSREIGRIEDIREGSDGLPQDDFCASHIKKKYKGLPVFQEDARLLRIYVPTSDGFIAFNRMDEIPQLTGAVRHWDRSTPEVILPEYDDRVFELLADQAIYRQDDGIVIMAGGFTVKDVYFSDINGDKLPDLCLNAVYADGTEAFVVSAPIDEYHEIKLPQGHRGRLSEKSGVLFTEIIDENGNITRSGRLTLSDSSVCIDGISPQAGSYDAPMSDMEAAIGKLLLSNTQEEKPSGLVRFIDIMDVYESPFILEPQPDGTEIGKTSGWAMILSFSPGDDIPKAINEELLEYDAVLKYKNGEIISTSVTHSPLKTANTESEEYILSSMRRVCYKRMIASLRPDTDKIIGELLDEISSSSNISGNPYDCISASPAAVKELINYGDFTLEYILRAFLRGGQDDLKGFVMSLILDELAPYTAVRTAHETGQMYFDSWLSHLDSLAEQNGEKWTFENYPVYELIQNIR